MKVDPSWKTLDIDEKWSVVYAPGENDSPKHVLRHGEIHASSEMDNFTVALFYRTLELTEELAAARGLAAGVKTPANAEGLTDALHPLDLSVCLKHAFLSGVVAAREIPPGDECVGPNLWVDYDPGHAAYERVTKALAPALASIGATTDAGRTAAPEQADTNPGVHLGLADLHVIEKALVLATHDQIDFLNACRQHQQEAGDFRLKEIRMMRADAVKGRLDQTKAAIGAVRNALKLADVEPDQSEDNSPGM